MRVRIAVLVFTLSVAASGTLFASEIYKWIDEEGNVHYSDYPTTDAELVAIRSRPTDPARIQADAQTRVDAQQLKAEQEANAPKGPSAEELRAEAEERQEKCYTYTRRQTRFTQSRRIYGLDENGERVYYDEDEMTAARANVDDLVDEYCK